MWSSSSLQLPIQFWVDVETPPPLLVIVDNEEHYKIEAILDSHIFCHKLQYQVK